MKMPILSKPSWDTLGLSSVDALGTARAPQQEGRLLIKRPLIAVAVVLVSVLVLSASPHATAQVRQANGYLKIATKQTPPFAMKETDGRWTGLAVELAQEIAERNGKRITWTEVETNQQLLNMVVEGRVDAAIAAITVTAEREKVVDFSHGYYDSGLAIAVQTTHDASFLVGLQALGSPAFLGTVGLLVALLTVIGVLVWLLETRQNASQFERHPIQGIGSGFWWATVTMTTVGYGDKVPVTPLGRLIAILWMFAALILTAVFTAHLTSALTLHRLEGPVKSPSDLSRSRVGVVDGTTSGAYLRTRAIGTIAFPSIASGLEAIQAGVIDAFVHDEPILRYEIQRNYIGRVVLLPQIFDPQIYGIAFPSGSALREPSDQALLAIVASPQWKAIKFKYLGSDANSL